MTGEDTTVEKSLSRVTRQTEGPSLNFSFFQTLSLRM